MPAREIELKLTAMGKDERAISISGYEPDSKFTLPELTALRGVA